MNSKNYLIEKLKTSLDSRKGIILYGDAIKTCIEALEKQVSKKPEVWANGTEHCPCCEHDLTYISSEDEYCCRCGQRLEGVLDER